MIGKNTLLQDNPLLNTRLSGLEFHQNKIIIVANSNNLPLKANVFQNIENNPVIIITNNREEIWQKFVDIGVKIIFAENLQSANEEHSQQIDWQKTLKILAQEQINSILVEGGSYLLTSLIKQNLIDELFWIRSNKIIGEPAISSIGQLEFGDISQSMVNFIPVDNWQFENDLISKFTNINIL
jgi:diaminohydroxyphosphoribosylaminopyrimidine deaminase/5-amino-6-(5-phosphoribosylamino)uracil reductase